MGTGLSAVKGDALPSHLAAPATQPHARTSPAHHGPTVQSRPRHATLAAIPQQMPLAANSVNHSRDMECPGSKAAAGGEAGVA